MRWGGTIRKSLQTPANHLFYVSFLYDCIIRPLRGHVQFVPIYGTGGASETERYGAKAPYRA